MRELFYLDCGGDRYMTIYICQNLQNCTPKKSEFYLNYTLTKNEKYLKKYIFNSSISVSTPPAPPPPTPLGIEMLGFLSLIFKLLTLNFSQCICLTFIIRKNKNGGNLIVGLYNTLIELSILLSLFT